MWTAMLPEDATRTARFKFELCERLLRAMHKQKLSQRALAKKLGVHESRVSEIIHYKIAKVSIEKLMAYLELVDNRVTFKVA